MKDLSFSAERVKIAGFCLYLSPLSPLATNISVNVFAKNAFRIVSNTTIELARNTIPRISFVSSPTVLNTFCNGGKYTTRHWPSSVKEAARMKAVLEFQSSENTGRVLWRHTSELNISKLSVSESED
jgi:hypothetical protein